MELFLIYAWLKVDTLVGLLFVFWLAYALSVAILLSLSQPDSWDKPDIKEIKIARVKKYRFRYIPWICFGVFLAIIPNSKQIAIIVGSSYAIDFSKSPTGEKVKSLILQKAESILDEELKAKKDK
jgi:accessory gene regulator protein AgrB